MPLKCVVLLLWSALALGCGAPFAMLPGGALKGSIADGKQINSIARTLEDGHVIQLETNPVSPYSVNIGVTIIDDELYIDPAEGRTWYGHILKDPDVRFRIAGHDGIYLARAVAVRDSALISRFEADRVPFRLEPR